VKKEKRIAIPATVVWDGDSLKSCNSKAIFFYLSHVWSSERLTHLRQKRLGEFYISKKLILLSVISVRPCAVTLQECSVLLNAIEQRKISPALDILDVFDIFYPLLLVGK